MPAVGSELAGPRRRHGAAGRSGVPVGGERAGSAHTATGGLEFVLDVLDRVERHCCRKAIVRMDAGYPAEELMRALE